MRRGVPLFVVATALLSVAWPGAGQCREDREVRDREREQRELHERRGEPYSSGEHDQIRSLQQRGAILPLEQILERARHHHQGRVLETELEQKGERYIYELELVDDQGQVWEMKFDAASGELLKERQED